ncbi:MAG: hypothetical protein IKS40_04500 [Treponema sp.]|nr:hypothetical protein [Treponema sp.]
MGATVGGYATFPVFALQKRRSGFPPWKREYMDAMMAAVHQEKEMRKAEEQGEHKRALEVARRFLQMGLLPEQVANGVGLPLDEVRALQEA